MRCVLLIFRIVSKGGDSMKKNKLLFWIFLSVFVSLLVCFLVVSAMVQNGVIANVAFNSSLQGVLVSVMFSPLIISIFFLAQCLKCKSGIWQNIYKILNFVSIALFCYMVIILILGFIG